MSSTDAWISAAVSTEITPSSLLLRTAISPDSTLCRSIQSRSGRGPVSGSWPTAMPAARAAPAAAIRMRGQAAAGRSVRRLIDDGIAQRAYAVDLHLDDVSGLHPQWGISSGPDAARRSGDDHVAGLEPGEGRAVRDERGHVEAELADAFPLHDVAVQPGLEPEPRGVGLLVRGDEPRPERAA